MTDLDHWPKPDRDCECGDCDWTGPESDIELSVFECSDLSERLTVGHPLPAGTCPACGSWAYVVTPYSRCRDGAADLLTELETAVARVELANSEGDPIMSAWLPGARAAIDKARGRA